jgi:hypothetical protein
MNTKTKMIAGLAAAGALLSMPVYAAGLKALDDSALSQVTGKDNVSSFGAADTLVIHNDNTNGSVSIGYFQWEDTHAADLSDHKGANDQSGSASVVQQSVSGELNALLWGAGAQVSTVNATLTAASIDSESWGTMYLGGF